MRRTGSALLAAVLVLATGCKGLKDKDCIDSSIRFSDRVEVMIGDSLLDLKAVNFRTPGLFFLLDTTKCLPCEYEMLYNFESYYPETGIDDSISFSVIVTPRSDYTAKVDYLNSINKYNFPILTDKSKTFYSKNDFFNVSDDEFQYIYVFNENKLAILSLPEQKLTYNIKAVCEYFESRFN